MKTKNLLNFYGIFVSVSLLLLMTACGSKSTKNDTKDEEDIVEGNDKTETENEEEEWNINGGDSDQPIMDGWTFEMAAEFYLTDELENDYSHVVRGEGNWLTPDSLARLTHGHVQVRIPIQQQDTKPRFGVTYRQPETDGTITFSGESCSNPTRYGDTLPAIGEATFHFDDDMYDYQTEPYTAYVQSRGKGLYTLYRMEGRRDDETHEWRDHCNPVWYPVIISVYPKGDSLVISRGMGALETFIPER